MGPSGCGKSTLLNVIAGLTDDGSVEVAGGRIDGRTRRGLAIRARAHRPAGGQSEPAGRLAGAARGPAAQRDWCD